MTTVGKLVKVYVQTQSQIFWEINYSITTKTKSLKSYAFSQQYCEIVKSDGQIMLYILNAKIIGDTRQENPSPL